MITKEQITERAKNNIETVTVDGLDGEVRVKKLTFRDVGRCKGKADADAWIVALGIVEEDSKQMFTVEETKDLPADIFLPLRDAVMEASGLKTPPADTEKN